MPAPPQEPASPRLIHYLLLLVLYFVAAKISQLTVMPDGIAILWLPNSVLLAIFIRYQGRGIPYFSVMAVAAELLADLPKTGVIEGLIFGCSNVLEATCAYALLAFWRVDPKFQKSGDVLEFLLAGPIIAALVAAACGTWAYSRFGILETPHFEYLRIWWFGDGLGLLIMTPAILGVCFNTETGAKRNVKFRHTDIVAAILILLILTLLLSAHDGKLLDVNVGPILLLPMILYAAARLPLHWVAIMVAVVAFAIIGMMAGGLAPFGELDTTDAAVHAQEFILIMSLMALGLAALLAQIRTRQEEIVLLNIRLEQRVKERTHALEQALAQVTQLQGLLPICVSCKKIRDDNNQWQVLEKYISERSEARFSHGICPECMIRQMKENK